MGTQPLHSTQGAHVGLALAPCVECEGCELGQCPPSPTVQLLKLPFLSKPISDGEQPA